jgi:hypothetical protein
MRNMVLHPVDVSYVNLSLIEIQVLDAQSQTFQDLEAGSIDQPYRQCVARRDGIEKPAHLVFG